MLGWEIIVTNQKQTLATWMATAWGTDWLRDLVKEGKAKDVAINSGYPHVFSMMAKDLIPILITGIPQINTGLVIGDDYAISGDKVWGLNLNQDLLKKCQPDDELMIEAWDQG